jgi:hypothetical protein
VGHRQGRRLLRESSIAKPHSTPKFSPAPLKHVGGRASGLAFAKREMRKTARRDPSLPASAHSPAKHSLFLLLLLSLLLHFSDKYNNNSKCKG